MKSIANNLKVDESKNTIGKKGKDLFGKICSRSFGRVTVLASLLFLLIISCIGCGEQVGEQITDQAVLEGLVLEVTDERILFVESTTSNDSNLMQKSTQELVQEGGYNLYWLTVEQVEQYRPGQRVKVWLSGPILESYPAQAQADKIELLD